MPSALFYSSFTALLQLFNSSLLQWSAVMLNLSSCCFLAEAAEQTSVTYLLSRGEAFFPAH